MLPNGISIKQFRQTRQDERIALQKNIDKLEKTLSPYLSRLNLNRPKFSAIHSPGEEDISLIRLSIKPALLWTIIDCLVDTLRCTVQPERNLFGISNGYTLITLNASSFTPENIEKLILTLEDANITENGIHVIAYTC